MKKRKLAEALKHARITVEVHNDYVETHVIEVRNDHDSCTYSLHIDHLQPQDMATISDWLDDVKPGWCERTEFGLS